MTGIEMLEGRRLMSATLPPTDGNPPPDNLVGNLGRGHSVVVIMVDDPNEIDDPNDRLLTPGGKIVALPAKALRGILKAISDPND